VLDTDKLSNKKNPDQNIIAWKTKEIVFYEDSLEKVLKTLNKVYNINIEIENEELLNSRYTSTFRNQDIDSILHVICLTFNLKVENTPEGIKLVKHNI
jgi:ferric-dicitrate binding protein FerR (iron transport regulator)